jgi:hypothetical protein
MEPLRPVQAALKALVPPLEAALPAQRLQRV